MAPDGLDQWLQKGGGLADPIGRGRAIQIEPLPVEDLALAVEWEMVGIFADQHMGEQAGAGTAAFDRARGQRGLDEPFTTGTCQPGADNPVHDEAPRNILQLFRDVLADPAQATAAIGTGIGAGHQFHFHPGDMIRDRTALGFALLLDVRQTHPRRHRGGRDLAGLKSQLKLFCRLRGRAEPVCPVPGQLVPQLLDQDRLRLHLGQKPRGEAAQLLGIFRQGQGLIEHARSLSHGIPYGNHSLVAPPDYPAAKGRHVRSGARQSIPSRSIDNCAGVSATFPSLAEGQTNRPRSSRFMNMQAPWPSHQMTFTRSPRRPRKTKRCPPKGSCFSTASACAAKEAKPLRMSVTPAASQTRVLAGTGITPKVPGSAAPAPQDHSCR